MGKVRAEVAEFDAEQRGYKEGVEVGSQQKAIETAKNLLKNNLDIQSILKYTGLSIEELNTLVK
ncbi:MAG: hypothetical protein UH788_02920 [Treponemataceae bacterium]|nr:hypothetical protein [Treponemataceae bacterium]